MEPAQRRLNREPPRRRSSATFCALIWLATCAAARLSASWRSRRDSLAVKVALQFTPLVVIGGVGDISFQLFLVVAFFHGLGSNGRAAVIQESAEAAAIQLELDTVILHHHSRSPARCLLYGSPRRYS